MREKIHLIGAKNIHFIGIGGISMSGLAEILFRDGYNVSGSDDVLSETVKRLSKIGIKTFVPNSAGNISDEIDMVVYTAAVKFDNPEFKIASEKGIPLIERAALIGIMLKGYENPVCVAGSHGKTTTTSMLAEVTLNAGLDPTISIGGHMNRDGMNYRVGESSYFVMEACEYSNSFHHWHPQVGIILNIDADHLDFFGNLDNVIASFAKFAANIRPEGALIIQPDVPGFCDVTDGLACEVITFGLKKTGARFWADNIHYNEGMPSFDIMEHENFIAKVDLPLPGQHNMLNALACFAAAYKLGISPEIAARALCNISGTKRRYEYKGEYNGVKIYDDYAHHPTEIKSCLDAVRKSTGFERELESGRIICLFQPHTYTRTKNHFEDFAKSFSDADKIILVPIYAAREPFDPAISSEMLAESIRSNGGDAVSVENFDKAGNFLRKELYPGDVLITMGAGDVYEVGDKLLRTKLSTVSTDVDE
ncbi:MAG: UDP-N-acetylmuramate--L-alanine ligase [Defluviitaleaceae bacterium]|nr:UDP-N-acetylmuramate--L-alanine ligase [Defluviitaleaceae bacterium]